MSPSTSKKANSALSSPFGRGKNHRAEHAGRYGHLRRRTYLAGRQGGERLQSAAAHRIPPVRRGLCIPVLQSGAEPDGAGKRGARQRDLQRAAALRPKRCARWGWSTAWATSRRSFRAASQQRVSIARALAKNPKILLCDEPTGALDYKTGKQVLALLQDTCRSTGRTVIVITHNSALTAMGRPRHPHQKRAGHLQCGERTPHPGGRDRVVTRL